MRNITFQFHITTENLEKDDMKRFIKLCETENVKPLLIILSEGEYVKQPMFTKLLTSSDFKQALKEAMDTSEAFKQNGFKTVRVKAEISSNEEYLFQDVFKGFKPYFEWHCKINTDNITLIKSICFENNAHISLNSLENDSNTKYVTVREYDDKDLFYKTTEKLYSEFLNKNIKILKQKFEYCIYDSKLELDRGWAN